MRRATVILARLSPQHTGFVSVCNLQRPESALARFPYTELENPFKMARKKKQLILTQPVRKGIKAIKVRLDHRTVITLSDLKKLAFWKERYPKAEVIA